MSKIKEYLTERTSYYDMLRQVQRQLDDIADYVDRVGGEIHISIKQDVLKYTGKGNMPAAMLNLSSKIKKARDEAEDVAKRAKMLK